MSFGPKLTQILSMIVILLFFMEAGHGEVNDIRNLKYDGYFLTVETSSWEYYWV